MSLPNYRHYVEQARSKWPQDWKDAHTGNANTETFCRKLGSWLHYEVDPKLGLNGKRGRPDDLSDDAFCYKAPGNSRDVRTGESAIVIDFIAAAGGPNPQPAWGEVWDPNNVPTPCTWVKPERIHDQSGQPPSEPPKPPTGTLCPDPSRHQKPDCPDPKAHTPKPYPGDRAFDIVGEQLEADYREAFQSLNAQSATWFARTIYDYLHGGMTLEESIKKHRAEWREVLGL